MGNEIEDVNISANVEECEIEIPTHTPGNPNRFNVDTKNKKRGSPIECLKKNCLLISACILVFSAVCIVVIYFEDKDSGDW